MSHTYRIRSPLAASYWADTVQTFVMTTSRAHILSSPSPCDTKTQSRKFRFWSGFGPLRHGTAPEIYSWETLSGKLLHYSTSYEYSGD